MKERMVKFLFERLEGKLTVLKHNPLEEHELEMLCEDIDDYVKAIKEIVYEVVQP